MNVLGIKFTHDGAVALVSNGVLKFSVEAEKLNNKPRYSEMSLEDVERILVAEGINVRTIDKVVIDGWKHGEIKRPFEMKVAPYHEFDGGSHDLFKAYAGPRITLLGHELETESYTHVGGHLFGAYAMSGISGPCMALVFDGGVNPRLYRGSGFDFELVQPLTGFYGLIYGIMGYYFGPYRKEDVIDGRADYRKEVLYGGYSVPGKLMAYIAYGKVNTDLLKDLMVFEACNYKGLGYEQDGILEHRAMIRAHEFCTKHKISDADALRTIHELLGILIIAGLRKYGNKNLPLLFVGGSALNIKWNSSIRRAGVCTELFVPPVPNDTGSAIGMAALGARTTTLKWDVYAGPKLRDSPVAPGWSSYECSTSQLALEINQQPVVVLYDRAEIGPRALGHRSIMANPMDPAMKHLLNDIKGREQWRPVAPICATADAPKYFEPGTPDPYMLFDHVMKADVRELFPAVLHIDNTARLQTLNSDDCQFTAELLEAMRGINGHPMVCNTSANLNGSGFFPDAASAMKWADGKPIYRVWSNGMMYRKEAK